MSTPKVSIVILTLNKWEYTRRCLNGLITQPYRPIELNLVDNGSTDGTVDKLKEFESEARAHGIEVSLRFNVENVGAATGRNHGLEMVSGEFVCFLDNDVVVRTLSWLPRMLGEFEAHPEVGAICPKLLFPFEPFNIQYAGLVISPNGRADYLGRGKPLSAPAFSVRRELQATISACMIMPADVVREVGPLDEDFNPVQFEDIDYSYRIRELGKTVVYLPEVEMYHFENVTTSNIRPGMGLKRATIVNGLKFKKKWRHVFSKEDGPDDADMNWEELPKVPLSEIGELQTVP